MKLSCVVVAYDMGRELPRTVHTLTRGQRGIDPADYEIVVVDNGSREPVEAGWFDGGGVAIRVLPMPDPTQSPAPALNHGATAARGDVIVSMVDGARMVSPGCLAWTLKAFALFGRCVVTAPAWHLGPCVQNEAVARGYDQGVEDRLLASVDWRADGTRLFDLCEAMDPSCVGTPWLGTMSESNVLGLRRDDYRRLGGFDEAFTSRGGGAVNLDMFRRACEGLDAPVVSLLGEGSFHQVHGGVSTNVGVADHPWDAIHEEYRRVRGHDFAWPRYAPVQLGRLEGPALALFERSRGASAAPRRARRPLAARLRAVTGKPVSP